MYKYIFKQKEYRKLYIKYIFKDNYLYKRSGEWIPYRRPRYIKYIKYIFRGK